MQRALSFIGRDCHEYVVLVLDFLHWLLKASLWFLRALHKYLPRVFVLFGRFKILIWLWPWILFARSKLAIWRVYTEPVVPCKWWKLSTTLHNPLVVIYPKLYKMLFLEELPFATVTRILQKSLIEQCKPRNVCRKLKLQLFHLFKVYMTIVIMAWIIGFHVFQSQFPNNVLLPHIFFSIREITDHVEFLSSYYYSQLILKIKYTN